MNLPQSNSLDSESLVLRFMREKRQLSLVAVAKKSGLKAKIIDHIENSRKKVTEKEIHLLLNIYQYPIEVFNEMLEIKALSKNKANLYFLRLS